MADYSITFARSARKELEGLSDLLVQRIFPKIEASKTPRPSGSRKLKASVALWRIRIGDYRVIYTVDDKLQLIDVIAIRHRSEAYD